MSGWVLLRTHGLTLLMLTLCTMALLEQAANMFSGWTGGFDGMPGLSFKPILGLFKFDVLFFRTQYLYALAVLFLCFVLVRMLVYSPFGRSLTGIRENLLRMHARGRRARAPGLVYAFGIAAGGAGAVLVQARLRKLAVLGLERPRACHHLILGGYGRLYGAFVGAILYMVLEHTLSKAYPTAWQLGLGLVLMLVALYARNGVLGLGDALRRRWNAR